MADLQGLGARLSEAEKTGVEIVAISPHPNEPSQKVAAEASEMTEASPVLDEDRLRRLVRELDAVVRRELPRFDGNEQDPGIALVELLAFVGDTLAECQDRTADEAYLEPPLALEVRRLDAHHLRTGMAIGARLPGPLVRRATISLHTGTMAGRPPSKRARMTP